MVRKDMVRYGSAAIEKYAVLWQVGQYNGVADMVRVGIRRHITSSKIQYGMAGRPYNKEDTVWYSGGRKGTAGHAE